MTPPAPSTHPGLAIRRRAALTCLLALALGLFGLHPASGQTTYELGGQGFRPTESPAAGTPGAELAAVRAALADGEPNRARKLATRWIEAHPDHPRAAEAYLLRGDAKAMDRDYYKSLFDYEIVARGYPASNAFFTALEREFEIAQYFAQGNRRKWLGMRFVPAAGEAEELLIRIQERAPGSKLAERAGKALGDFYFRRGEMLLAAEAYGIFADNYPSSQWAAYAARRRIDANLGRFKGPRFDATGLLEAERQLIDFQDDFPADAERHGARELLVRIDESLARKSLAAAEYYDGQNMTVSAVYMYTRVVTDHPDSAAAKNALIALERLDPDKAQQLRAGDFERRPRGSVSPQAPEGSQPIGGRPETDRPSSPAPPPAREPIDTNPENTQPE